MLSGGSQQLADDHSALNEILVQLQETLNGDDIAAIHSHLDLFWARLAVHIRAEHLHLFPSLISRLSEKTAHPSLAPNLREAQLAVEQLRSDHEFFMHELGRAIQTVRDLSQPADAIRKPILEIEKRLVVHNDREENQIYRWATTLLNEEEQADLAMRINRELTNLPPRFRGQSGDDTRLKK
ncbi:MAG TPA: hemerythrin domain-containing protein [Pyrinomonadaceae bacterium]|nr:hemerythrin domain-containing protein [Pyrinomonadaceae bacterium]